MYEVTYYINRIPYSYEGLFNSLWGATFKARAIFEQHGLATDIMDTETGEILAIFEPNNIWVKDELDKNIRFLAMNPIH